MLEVVTMETSKFLCLLVVMLGVLYQGVMTSSTLSPSDGSQLPHTVSQTRDVGVLDSSGLVSTTHSSPVADETTTAASRTAIVATAVTPTTTTVAITTGAELNSPQVSVPPPAESATNEQSEVREFSQSLDSTGVATPSSSSQSTPSEGLNSQLSQRNSLDPSSSNTVSSVSTSLSHAPPNTPGDESSFVSLTTPPSHQSSLATLDLSDPVASYTASAVSSKTSSHRSDDVITSAHVTATPTRQMVGDSMSGSSPAVSELPASDTDMISASIQLQPSSSSSLLSLLSSLSSPSPSPTATMGIIATSVAISTLPPPSPPSPPSTTTTITITESPEAETSTATITDSTPSTVTAHTSHLTDDITASSTPPTSSQSASFDHSSSNIISLNPSGETSLSPSDSGLIASHPTSVPSATTNLLDGSTFLTLGESESHSLGDLSSQSTPVIPSHLAVLSSPVYTPHDSHMASLIATERAEEGASLQLTSYVLEDNSISSSDMSMSSAQASSYTRMSQDGSESLMNSLYSQPITFTNVLQDISSPGMYSSLSSFTHVHSGDSSSNSNVMYSGESSDMYVLSSVSMSQPGPVESSPTICMGCSTILESEHSEYGCTSCLPSGMTSMVEQTSKDAAQTLPVSYETLSLPLQTHYGSSLPFTFSAESDQGTVAGTSFFTPSLTTISPSPSIRIDVSPVFPLSDTISLHSDYVQNESSLFAGTTQLELMTSVWLRYSSVLESFVSSGSATAFITSSPTSTESLFSDLIQSDSIETSSSPDGREGSSFWSLHSYVITLSSSSYVTISSPDVMPTSLDHLASRTTLPVTYTVTSEPVDATVSASERPGPSISPSRPTTVVPSTQIRNNDTTIIPEESTFTFYFDGDCQKFSAQASSSGVFNSELRRLILNASRLDDVRITVKAVSCSPNFFTATIKHTDKAELLKRLDLLVSRSLLTSNVTFCSDIDPGQCTVRLTKYELYEAKVFPRSPEDDDQARAIVLSVAVSVCVLLLAAGALVFAREIYKKRTSQDLAAQKKKDKRQRSESVALRSFPTQTAIYSTVEMTEDDPAYDTHSEAHLNPAFSDSLDRRVTSLIQAKSQTPPPEFDPAPNADDSAPPGVRGGPFNLPPSRASYGLVIGLLGVNKMADNEAHHYAVPHRVGRPQNRADSESTGTGGLSSNKPADESSGQPLDRDNSDDVTLPRPRYLKRAMTSPADSGSSENLLPRGSGQEQARARSVTGIENPLATRTGSSDSVLI